MLTAKNSIEINVPVETVWEYLTKPGTHQTWIESEAFPNCYITSEWNASAPVYWKDEENEDYARGVVLKIEPKKILAFSMHDAYEEDNYDPEFGGPDWNEETWTFSLAEKDGRTIVELSIGDYDQEHDTDDDHDHEEVEKICKEESEQGIPDHLKKLKAALE